MHYQDITTFRDIIDDSVDEFKSTKDTIQLDDSDSESEEDENISSDVPNILINEIVSPVIEQSKEIGTPSSQNCTVSLETVDKLSENYKENTGGPHVEIVSIESTLERENEREEKCLPLIKNDMRENCNHFPLILEGHGTTEEKGEDDTSILNAKKETGNHFPLIPVQEEGHGIKEVERD